MEGPERAGGGRIYSRLPGSICCQDEHSGIPGQASQAPQVRASLGRSPRLTLTLSGSLPTAWAPPKTHLDTVWAGAPLGLSLLNSRMSAQSLALPVDVDSMAPSGQLGQPM